ncbi:MAG TPA: hypothetical protein DCY23_03335 [Ruminococcaceae bacterium]|nr:hypothetical protein [Oscillospiraceae bacterium]
MLKVALVGVGGISGAHIPAWEERRDAELVALCDIRAEQMEKYKNKHCYTDFDEMLKNEKIDILDICLPTYLHAEFAIKAMNMGINVICEKPVSLNAADVARVYSAAKSNNVKFMVAQVLRFWPEYSIIKEIYDTGKYGRLLSGHMGRLGVRPKWSWGGWMMDENRSGLVPFDLHIHDLDFIVYAFGKPKEFKDYRARSENQDYINSIYEYDGFFITTEAAWYDAPYPFAANFRFQFEKALAVFENHEMTIYEKDGKIFKPVSQSGEDTGDIGLPKSNAYANEINYFADCVLSGAEPDRVKPAELETVISILKAL